MLSKHPRVSLLNHWDTVRLASDELAAVGSFTRSAAGLAERADQIVRGAGGAGAAGAGHRIGATAGNGLAAREAKEKILSRARAGRGGASGVLKLAPERKERPARRWEGDRPEAGPRESVNLTAEESRIMPGANGSSYRASRASSGGAGQSHGPAPSDQRQAGSPALNQSKVEELGKRRRCWRLDTQQRERG